jgi:type IV pilus assembly protein PilV
MIVRSGPGNGLNRAAGFTLVEVLIALVVLSIGMLGIAALYLESLRSGRAALYRTQAVTLAADIGDRIRANRADDGAYGCGNPCNPGTGIGTLPQTELQAWLDRIEAQLPGGGGAITYTAGTAVTPAAYEITVSWNEVGNDDPLTYDLRVEI